MFKIFYRFKKKIAYAVLLGQSFSICMPLGAQSQQEVQSSAPAKQVNLYTDVANLYLKSFNVIETPVAGPSVDEMLKKGQKIELQKRELSPAQLRHLAFNLLSRCSTYKDVKLGGVLDLSFVKKMELLCGQESSQAHLFSLVNHSKTIFGEAALARMLATPVADVVTLKKRQAIIQELVTNEKLFQDLDAALGLIKKSEQQMLGFWQTESQANEYLFNQVYFGSTLWLDRLNKSTVALEVGTRLGNAASLAGLCDVPLILYAAIFPTQINIMQAQMAGRPLSLKRAYGQGILQVLSGIKTAGVFLFDPRLKVCKGVNSESDFVAKISSIQEKISDKYHLNSFDYSYDRRAQAEQEFVVEAFPKTLRDTWKMTDVAPRSSLPASRRACKLGIVGAGALVTAYKAWTTYAIVSHEKRKNQITNYVQEKMIDVARYVRGMKKSYAIAHANDQLKGIESLESLAQLQGSSKNSAQFNTLLGMLDHSTFKGNPSFFSITGRVLASYKVMQEAKDEFTYAMEAAGELDAYLSMAKLMKEFAYKRVGYSYVQFVEREKPMIQAIDFWNPFIAPDVVVTNSLWMGTEQYPNNVVITGPNTGGKSTVVKGMLIALVLAQTFGIAPAQELTITPFTKLNCHLNITDDIAAGTSLFKAEVLKAKELINGVQALKSHEFSCTAMDEAFNGTEPKAGAEASYKFSERLASFDNSMVLLATHFPELTKLEEAGKFKNWQVKVIRRDNGSLERPFKLEPGISTLNVALDLLREEGVLL